MYAPTTQTVSSGLRGVQAPRLNVDIAGDMKSDFQDIGKAYLDQENKKAKENQDYFDIQKEESDKLNKALDGLEGKDYEAMMDNVVRARDELADLFVGKSLKDYNTPEFRRKLFEVQKGIGLDVAASQKTIGEYKQILALKDGDIKHGNMEKIRLWVNSQMQLPPSQREKDPIAYINNNSDFRNAPDMLQAFGKRIGEDVTPKSVDNGINILNSFTKNYKAFYDKDGNFNMSNETLDQLYAEEPWFKQQMQKMAFEPAELKILQENGHTEMIDLVTRQFTKDYIKHDQTLKNREEARNPTGKPTPVRATVSDKKEASAEEKAQTFHTNLLKSDTALRQYKGPEKDGSIGDFKVERKDNKIIITPQYWGKTLLGKLVLAEPNKKNEWVIQNDNPDTVKAFLEWADKSLKYSDSDVADEAPNNEETDPLGLNF